MAKSLAHRYGDKLLFRAENGRSYSVLLCDIHSPIKRSLEAKYTIGKILFKIRMFRMANGVLGCRTYFLGFLDKESELFTMFFNSNDHKLNILQVDKDSIGSFIGPASVKCMCVSELEALMEELFNANDPPEHKLDEIHKFVHAHALGCSKAFKKTYKWGGKKILETDHRAIKSEFVEDIKNFGIGLSKV